MDMGLPTIAKYSRSAEIAKRLACPFQKAVFAAAMKSLEQKDNPLRFNNFATNLRELGRMMLEGLAPDKSIKACAWYKPELNEKKQEIITRAQRIKFAVQAVVNIHAVFRLPTLPALIVCSAAALRVL
jgi:hypothetical protein